MDPDAKTYNMIFTKAPSCCIKSSDGAIDLGMQRNRVIVEG